MSDDTDPCFPDGRPEWAEEYTAARRLRGDEWLCVIPCIFGSRLAVCTPDNARVEDWMYDQQSYGDAVAAVAWLKWPEPPRHWTRHVDRNGDETHPDDVHTPEP